jgi:hypothetical protein
MRNQINIFKEVPLSQRPVTQPVSEFQFSSDSVPPTNCRGSEACSDRLQSQYVVLKIVQPESMFSLRNSFSLDTISNPLARECEIHWVTLVNTFIGKGSPASYTNTSDYVYPSAVLESEIWSSISQLHLVLQNLLLDRASSSLALAVGFTPRPEIERRPETGDKSFVSVFAFDGAAPEAINSRMAWAFVAEKATGLTVAAF